jgi:membrane associated rhomboid family serine protease
VTLAIVAVNVVVHGQMVLEPGPVNDPETLIRWGAHYGPVTTNGQWWRLVTATFVHAGLLHLIATIAGLVPVGMVLERIVGPIAFATVYLAAGILANLANLSDSALAVCLGASGAVFGLYGLLAGTLAWLRLRALFSKRPPSEDERIEVPMIVAKRLGTGFAVFAVYNLITADLFTSSEIAGLTVGVAGGVGLMAGVGVQKPPARRVAVAAVGTLVVALAFALPLRGIADVRPALQRLVLVEERTSAAYDAKVGDYRKGWITEEVLVQQIERTILPELSAAYARLMAVKGVPQEHRPLVAAADEYFRLRERSWRRRAQGLVETSMRMLQEADRAERESLAAFQRLKSSGVLSRAGSVPSA